MRQVKYNASNSYSCQGVKLTPGLNEVAGSKFDDFIAHPGVVARMGLGVIEVLSGEHEEKHKDMKEASSEEVKVVSEASQPVNVSLSLTAAQPQVSHEVDEKAIEEMSVKQGVAAVSKIDSLLVLQKVVDSSDSVRVKKAANERISDLLKTEVLNKNS